MDESVREQEREKQTLLKVRTHMSAHISRAYAAHWVILYAYLMHWFISVLYVFQTHMCWIIVMLPISACWFRFDVELEVRHRSRADAVRVPAGGCYGDHDGPSSDGGINLTPKGQIKHTAAPVQQLRNEMFVLC